MPEELNFERGFIVGGVYTFSKLLSLNVAELSTENF